MASGTRTPSTIVTITLTGQTEFNIPFEYLARKFVVLTLIGKDRTVLVLNTDYRFISKTKVSLTNPTPAGYEKLEIRRDTSASERLVDFHDGSILRASDMNLSQVQTLHVAEEARDLTADTIGVNDDGDLDARGRKIVNLGDATEPSDAVTLRQEMQWADSALNSANRAEASEVVVIAAANEAFASKNAAFVYKEEAKVSAANAATSEAQADISAEAASVSAVNSSDSAIVSVTNAATAEAAAVDANLAKDRAILEAAKLGNMNDLAECIDFIDLNYKNVGFKGKLVIGVNGASPRDAVTVEQLTVRDDLITNLDSKLDALEDAVDARPYIVRRIQLDKTHAYTDVGMRTEWSDGYCEISGSALGSSAADTDFYFGGDLPVFYQAQITDHYYFISSGNRNTYIADVHADRLTFRSGMGAPNRCSITVTGRWKV
jgi:hypothetical protein